jgi:hypothetical protein
MLREASAPPAVRREFALHAGFAVAAYLQDAVGYEVVAFMPTRCNPFQHFRFRTFSRLSKRARSSGIGKMRRFAGRLQMHLAFQTREVASAFLNETDSTS